MPKFSDLPNFLKHHIFQFLNKDSLAPAADKGKHSLGEVSREFANLTSQHLTRFWTESSQAAGWINLHGSNPATLKLELFAPPRLVLRTAIRPPEVILQSGFRRRGKRPQFIPGNYSTLSDYLERILISEIKKIILQPTNKEANSSKKPKLNLIQQFPWDTLVSTFDFNELQNQQFKKALIWSSNYMLKKDFKWIYFALGHLGVETHNTFNEIALLGILPTDIIAAIQIKINEYAPEMPSKYWINKDCDAKKFHKKIYNSVVNFIEQKRNEYPQLEEYLPKLNPESVNIKRNTPNFFDAISPAVPNLYYLINYLHGLMYAYKGNYSAAKFFLNSLTNTSYSENSKTVLDPIEKFLAQKKRIESENPNKAAILLQIINQIDKLSLDFLEKTLAEFTTESALLEEVLKFYETLSGDSNIDEEQGSNSCYLR